MSENGIPVFVMKDRIVENLNAQIDSYMRQGITPDVMELILYKVLSDVQAKKCQGYANEYLKLMQSKEESKEENKDE